MTALCVCGRGLRPGDCCYCNQAAAERGVEHGTHCPQCLQALESWDTPPLCGRCRPVTAADACVCGHRWASHADTPDKSCGFVTQHGPMDWAGSLQPCPCERYEAAGGTDTTPTPKTAQRATGTAGITSLARSGGVGTGETP